MRRLAMLMIALAAPAFAQTSFPKHASPAAGDDDGTAALLLFQQDAMLHYWALKHYDSDGDIALSKREAAAAAEGLKSIADGDFDGQVTTDEFGRVREFIAARF